MSYKWKQKDWKMKRREKRRSLEISRRRQATGRRRLMPLELKEHLNRVKEMQEWEKSFSKRRKLGFYKILMLPDKNSSLKKRTCWPLKLRRREMNSWTSSRPKRKWKKKKEGSKSKKDKLSDCIKISCNNKSNIMVKKISKRDLIIWKRDAKSDKN